MKNTKHGNMPLGYEVNISAMAVSILFDGLVLDDFFGIPILGHTRMCLVSKVGAIVKSWTVDCIYILGDGHPLHFHISVDICIYIGWYMYIHNIYIYIHIFSIYIYIYTHNIYIYTYTQEWISGSNSCWWDDQGPPDFLFFVAPWHDPGDG